MFYLLNFPYTQTKCSTYALPMALTLEQLWLLLIHLQKELLDAVEEVWL